MKHRIVFAMIMSSITTGIISFTLIAVNVGFIERFMLVWLRSWALSYLLATFAILLISPKVQFLVDYIFRQKAAVEKD
jgi:hypothetical protein